MEDTPSPDATTLPEEPASASVPVTWSDLGFAPHTADDGTLKGTIPGGVFILAATTPDANRALSHTCKPITTAHPFRFEVAGCSNFAYAMAEGITLPERFYVPEGVNGFAAGATVPLSDSAPYHCLPIVGAEQIALLASPPIDPVIVNSPLAQFSLRGTAELFERQAVKAKPLLGNLCYSGQATVWYAPPNAGKTLIVLNLLNEAVAEGRITPDNVFYINADDSSEGFATKIRLMDDIGVHTLAPGHKGFDARLLPDLFREMADRKKAKGALIIIDTIKKAASLMDKSKASAFTAACRSAVMAGATIVGFAHTNKQPSASGKLQYGGTSDLRDDFDAAYVMGPIEVDGFEGDKVVAFECIKSRGGNARSATYVYADDESVSYSERLASVRLVSDDEMQGFRRIEEAKADADVVEAIEACIRNGDYAKMALARAVAKQTGISERAAIRMIEKYTGTDPATAKWCFKRKDRGAMIFTLLAPPADEASLAA